MPTNFFGVSTGPRQTTHPHRQERRERAADRLRAALSSEAHRFGTKKTRGINPDGSAGDNPTAEAAARLRAEQCLRNLETKNVRPA